YTTLFRSYVRFQVCKNAVHPFQLPWVFGKKINIVFPGFPVLKVFDQKIKLPVKRWLFLCVKRYFYATKMRCMAKFNNMPQLQLRFDCCYRYKIVVGYVFFLQMFIIIVQRLFGCFLYPEKYFKVF